MYQSITQVKEVLDAKPGMTQRFFGLLTWVRLDRDELDLHNPVGNHASLSIMQDGNQSAAQTPPLPNYQFVC